MPTVGDIKKQLNSYNIKWQELHNGASSQYIIDLVNSESFKIWIESHPDGQVEDYLEFLKEENSYFTSPEFRIDYLRKKLETTTSENSQLHHQLQIANEQLYNYKISLYITCGLSSISILLAIFIAIKYLKIKRVLRKQSML